ncbi:MAG: DUF2284 domain-containing protein [Candidatus Helarchaeota archaeon]
MVKLDIQEITERVKRIAINEGAIPDLFVRIKPNQVVVSDAWVNFKCRFGCPNYGNNLCCPPFAPTPEEIKKLLKEYSEAILIGFPGDSNPKNYREMHEKMHGTLLKLEGEVFKAGYVKAFVFFTGSCALCENCVLEELPSDIHPEMAIRFCRHKNKMRPSMEAVGIDVFETVKNAGIEMEIITMDNLDKIKYFGLLLIE